MVDGKDPSVHQPSTLRKEKTGLERARIPETGFLVGEGQRVVCLGDSITQAPDGYVTVMANLIAAVYPERGIRVLNAGISGNKVPDMRERLERDVIARDPDWVTVNVGINDVWHGYSGFGLTDDYPEGDGPNGVPLDIYERTLADLVETLLARSRANVLLVTPTVIGEEPDTHENRKLTGYVEAMERVGRAAGVRVCPMRQAFMDALRRGKSARSTCALTTDGVHPNPVGHYVIAVTILKSLGFFERTIRLKDEG
jgi:acyl-CoA thioesterase-1